MKRYFLPFLLLSLATAAQAQQPGQPAATVIAVPPLTSPNSGTRGNEMLAVGWQVTHRPAPGRVPRQTPSGSRPACR